MRISGEETATMSRSFLMKKYNYSHCPLKKRPVQYIKEEQFDDKGELSFDLINLYFLEINMQGKNMKN